MDQLVKAPRGAVVDLALGKDQTEVDRIRRIVRRQQLAEVGDPRGFEETKERNVVEVAHRIEIAEADSIGVDVGPAGGRAAAHSAPQRKPVCDGAGASGLPGRSRGGSGKL